MPSFDHPNSKKDASSISRRNLLAAVGMGTFGMTASVPKVSGDTNDSNEMEVSPRQQRELRRTALADEQVRDLRQSLIEDGWRPVMKDIIVLNSAGETEKEYHTVTIPFTRPNTDDQAAVLWTDDGPFPVQARTFTTLSEDEIQMDTTLVEQDGLTTESVTIVPDFWWWFCSDLNWPCVLTIAGAWAGAFASCAACLLDPTRITCLSCIGAVLAATGGTLGCDWCNS